MTQEQLDRANAIQAVIKESEMKIRTIDKLLKSCGLHFIIKGTPEGGNQPIKLDMHGNTALRLIMINEKDRLTEKVKQFKKELETI